MASRSAMTCAVALALGLIGRGAFAAPAPRDSIPRLPERDRIRLAEAFRLADAIQNQVWPEWSTAPFGVLLITPTTEFLIRHPQPSPDFTAGDFDSLLGSRVYSRRRVFPPNLQATFPAVSGVSTIVIGEAESARPKQSSTRWILTLMHEHFHQWQESRPGYQAAVAKLDLARGDSTGIWMLNFPFPYEDSTLARGFDQLCRLRVQALRLRGSWEFADAYRAYDEARRRFAAHVTRDDARYLDFQLWKEGVARYTEYEVARVAALRYVPSPRYEALDDYTSFMAEAQNVLDQIIEEQSTLSLAKWKRTAVYSTGAADALLLDRQKPDWKSRYLRERFSLDRLIALDH